MNQQPEQSVQFAFKLLTAQEVAQLLGLKAKTVYDLAAKGIIPRVQIGFSVRFNSLRLQEWIEAGGAAAGNNSTEAHNEQL